MANNCLFKELKCTVNYDDPVYLDKVLLTVSILEGYGDSAKQCFVIRDDSGQPVMGLHVETLNTDGAEAYYLSDMVMIKKGTGSQVKVLIDKYPVKYFRILNQEITVPMSQVVRFINTETLELIERFTGDVQDINNLQNLKNIYMTQVTSVFSISLLTEIPSIEVIDFADCHGPKGDLAAIKDMPNLTSVTLNKTDVTDNNNSVAYLQNRGVTVSYARF